MEWAEAFAARDGEADCGDRCLVVPRPDGWLLAVVDGLGHGDEACAAAEHAIATLRTHSTETVLQLVERCHTSLTGTRGAVMNLAIVRPRERTLTWTGIGNVEGLLLRADPRERPSREALVTRAGVIGDKVPTPMAVLLPLRADDTLIFATDGIDPAFELTAEASGSPQRIADRILAGHRKKHDDALVLVARYLAESPEP